MLWGNNHSWRTCPPVALFLDVGRKAGVLKKGKLQVNTAKWSVHLTPQKTQTAFIKYSTILEAPADLTTYFTCWLALFRNVMDAFISFLWLIRVRKTLERSLYVCTSEIHLFWCWLLLVSTSMIILNIVFDPCAFNESSRPNCTSVLNYSHFCLFLFCYDVSVTFFLDINDSTVFGDIHITGSFPLAHVWNGLLCLKCFSYPCSTLSVCVCLCLAATFAALL